MFLPSSPAAFLRATLSLRSRDVRLRAWAGAYICWLETFSRQLEGQGLFNGIINSLETHNLVMFVKHCEHKAFGMSRRNAVVTLGFECFRRRKTRGK
jgi:hypothetical protein